MSTAPNRAPICAMITNELIYADGAIAPLAVAWHLALEERFAHALVRHWSSAHHTIIVSDIVATITSAPVARMYGLLHDMTDSYMRDIPSPMKSLGQRWLEERMTKAHWSAWGLPELTAEAQAIVKAADLRALLAEASLFAVPVVYSDLQQRYGEARPEDVVRAKHFGSIFCKPAAAYLWEAEWATAQRFLPAPPRNELLARNGEPIAPVVHCWLAAYSYLRRDLGLPVHAPEQPSPPAEVTAESKEADHV